MVLKPNSVVARWVSTDLLKPKNKGLIVSFKLDVDWVLSGIVVFILQSYQRDECKAYFLKGFAVSSHQWCLVPPQVLEVGSIKR